jgi:hypothetical protein
MFFAFLSSADPSYAACECKISMQTDSFAIGSGALVNICHVFIALLWILKYLGIPNALASKSF